MCGLCAVYLVLFAFHFDVIDRLCSVIVAFPAHFRYYFKLHYAFTGDCVAAPLPYSFSVLGLSVIVAVQYFY